MNSCTCTAARIMSSTILMPQDTYNSHLGRTSVSKLEPSMTMMSAVLPLSYFALFSYFDRPEFVLTVSPSSFPDARNVRNPCFRHLHQISSSVDTTSILGVFVLIWLAHVFHMLLVISTCCRKRKMHLHRLGNGRECTRCRQILDR
jgi:hypothetical protein